MYGNEWEIEAFFNDLYYYVSEVVNLRTYRNMDDEKREKLKSKITIMVCREFSPRKNFDISKAEIREYVSRIIVAELIREDELNELT